MTRNVYEKFAAMLADELALAKVCDRADYRTLLTTQVRAIVHSTADIFAQDNPRFNRDRFYRACGLY